MDKTSLATLRRELKFKLKTSRVEITRGGIIAPICAICAEPILHSVEMHEVFTRGQARNVNVNIFVQENCVLVHPGTCHKTAQHSDLGKTLCDDYLIHYEGLAAVYNFREKVINNSLSLGEISMADLKKLVEKLQERGIEADGTIENAIQLGRKHGVLNGWGQDAGSMNLLFAGKRKAVATKTPVEDILQAILDEQPAKQPEKKSDGDRDPAPEDS